MVLNLPMSGLQPRREIASVSAIPVIVYRAQKCGSARTAKQIEGRQIEPSRKSPPSVSSLVGLVGSFKVILPAYTTYEDGTDRVSRNVGT